MSKKPTKKSLRPPEPGTAGDFVMRGGGLIDAILDAQKLGRIDTLRELFDKHETTFLVKEETAIAALSMLDKRHDLDVESFSRSRRSLALGVCPRGAYGCERIT